MQPKGLRPLQRPVRARLRSRAPRNFATRMDFSYVERLKHVASSGPNLCLASGSTHGNSCLRTHSQRRHLRKCYTTRRPYTGELSREGSGRETRPKACLQVEVSSLWCRLHYRRRQGPRLRQAATLTQLAQRSAPFSPIIQPLEHCSHPLSGKAAKLDPSARCFSKVGLGGVDLASRYAAGTSPGRESCRYRGP